MTEVPNTFADLFWGYSILWCILVVYLLRLGAKVKNLEKQLGDE